MERAVFGILSVGWGFEQLGDELLLHLEHTPRKGLLQRSLTFEIGLPVGRILIQVASVKKGRGWWRLELRKS